MSTVINLDTENYKRLLREKLDDYRYNHSLAVAERAAHLAKKYGADRDKAFLAGLLHDITKNYSREEHLKILSEFDIILSDVDLTDNLLHAVTGSVYVENILKIEDYDVINSIRYHTTARAGMSLLEKVIYLADYTSSDRKYPDVDVMRRLSDENIDEAMVYSLSYTFKKLIGLAVAIHPDSVAAYNEIVLYKNIGENRLEK